MKSTVNKIKSVILGHAVGDALGVPVEFKEREELSKCPVTDMLGYGTYPVPAGTWSDDTSMTLAALDAMTKTDWSCFDVMVSFVKWLEEGEYTPTGRTFDVGRTCLKALRSFAESCRSGSGEFIMPPGMEITDFGQTDEYSNGNGSLMRINPFVLFACFSKFDYWLWMACVRTGSCLTHAHDRSLLACYIYGYCLTELLREGSMDSLRMALDFAGKDLDFLPEIEHYSRIFDPDFDRLTADEIKSSGYVVDTLEAALWCVLTTDSYKDCVLKAVNLGGDTDTIAAIAGGLAGALYGYESIPQEWLNTLIKREYIENMCERAGKCWCAQTKYIKAKQ